MKKTLWILCATVLALASCSKELSPTETDQQTKDPVEVVFNLSVMHPDATKAVKDDWETGDVVFVFFSGQTAPAYLELKFNGTTWVNTQKGLSFSASESGTMTAVYLPFGSGATVKKGADGTSYEFDKTYYSYYLTGELPYTVSGGEVSGKFSMKIPEGFVQFFLDDETADSTKEMELREPHLTPQGIASISQSGAVVPAKLAHGAPLPGYVYDKEKKDTGEKKGWLFSGILVAEARNNPTNYHFTLVCGGWKGQYYGRDFKTMMFYRFEEYGNNGRALKFPALSGWTLIENYKPIDLGCDVDGKRIYWCSRNIGALCDEPEADTDDARQASWGDYFSWGGTAPKTDYSWTTYEHLTLTPGYTDYYAWKGINKYTVDDGTKTASWYDSDGNFIGDNKTVLEPKDDAAHVVMKGLWRMPTAAEWEALRNTTNFQWINAADSEKGRKVYSNFNPDYIADGRYIFLPYAGFYDGAKLDYHTYGGYYWSSSLYEYDTPRAYHNYLNSSNITYDLRDRYLGFSVRAVMN